ncbi:MAG: NAD(P)H-dependent oxidoreductase [Solirubrobacteraceae bacterium]|nr:NAD(P)H-dependent oxidoreductase [Solirubrobacteraceae bacterium]
MSTTVLSVIGNPRAESRTHGIARTLSAEIARVLDAETGEVDLAPYGSRVLDFDDHAVAAEVDRVLAADVLVVASPTYKATYSGLLKAFLDRVGTGALTGSAVPVLLGGAPNHTLAVDTHFTPLLQELGAATPTRGLFVLESELSGFDDAAAAWADRWGPWLLRSGAPVPAR